MMPYFEDAIADNVKPLSEREKCWLKRLERVLQACPSTRLEAFTIGDADLTFIDGKIRRAADLEIHDGKAAENEIVLASVRSRFPIHAVSG